MAQVKAKVPCYLGDAGYKTPDDGVFDYNGPQHNSLEYIENEKAEPTPKKSGK